MKKPLCVSGRQLLCLSDLVDRRRTTAHITVGEFRREETVLVHDAPWEGDHCGYYNILQDDGGLLRMYYLSHDCAWAEKEIRVCYAESRDNGKTWDRPDLGLRAYRGNVHTNILLDAETDQPADGHFDNFFVFKDTNPRAKKEERYKALARVEKGHRLEWFASEDGIRFARREIFPIDGFFDSLNTCHYDNARKLYFLYFRNFHDIPGNDWNAGIRDVCVTTSRDFLHWSAPRRIDFGKGAEDYPLYTNNVMPYPGNPDLKVGFPTRYMERKAWTANYDALPSPEKRRARMRTFGHNRFGMTVTDCVFMASRDGKRWQRFDDAIITPGPEESRNWVYGDCYPAYAMLEDGDRYVMLDHLGEWSGTPTELFRISIRKDGFAYYRAGYEGARVVTRPIVFEGGRLSVNFATSARGYLYVDVTDEDGNTLSSCELFGDNVERTVPFDGDLAAYAGKPVKLTFRMRDAKIYSFTFSE